MLNCDWCGHEYKVFNRAEEDAHLAVCPVFQALPVAERREDGREFVALPGHEDILVERTRVV